MIAFPNLGITQMYNIIEHVAIVVLQITLFSNHIISMIIGERTCVLSPHRSTTVYLLQSQSSGRFAEWITGRIGGHLSLLSSSILQQPLWHGEEDRKEIETSRSWHENLPKCRYTHYPCLEEKNILLRSPVKSINWPNLKKKGKNGIKGKEMTKRKGRAEMGKEGLRWERNEENEWLGRESYPNDVQVRILTRNLL